MNFSINTRQYCDCCEKHDTTWDSFSSIHPNMLLSKAKFKYLHLIEKCIIKALTPIFGLHKALAWSCWDGDLEKRVEKRVLSSFLCSLHSDNVGPVLRCHSVSPQLFSLGCGLAQGGLRPSNPSWQLSNYCGGRLWMRAW